MKKRSTFHYIIWFVVIIVVLLCVYALFLLKRTNSMIGGEDKLIEYLSSNFNSDNFTIVDKETIQIKCPTGYFGCDYRGYSWSVEYKKNGVTFDVYDDIVGCTISSNKCIKGIRNNYLANAANKIKNEYDLLTLDVSDFSITEESGVIEINLSSFDSLEDAASYLYEIIEKYDLNLDCYSVDISIRLENGYARLEAKDIHSSEDIVEQYNKYS